jgi:hypothetical protein
LGKKRLPALLVPEGFTIKVHDDHFDDDAADDVWLSECGKKRWVVITPDTNILKDPQSMMAIGSTKGTVFFLSNNNMGPEEWARILIAARNHILTTIRNHPRPFVARVSPSGGVWQITELTKLGREKKKPKTPRIHNALAGASERSSAL